MPISKQNTDHNVGDLLLYVRNLMDGTKIYELGIIKSIMPPSTPYRKRYIIDWVDGEQRMQKSYSDHDIQTYKELLEIYMDGREPDRVLKVI